MDGESVLLDTGKSLKADAVILANRSSVLLDEDNFWCGLNPYLLSLLPKQSRLRENS
jgi:hypothetical protein